MADTPDLGKIVSLIMENPDLISKIQGLAKADAQETEDKAIEGASTDAVAKKDSEDAEQVFAVSEEKKRRTKLLHAMKPYLSSERAKAIDSMISMAEILDMMKQR